MAKDAKYWNDKGDAFSETQNFEEAIKCYAESEKINSNESNTFKSNTFKNWATALSRLAGINKDEALFQEAFKKYDRAAQLETDDIGIFLLWGYALITFIEIKKDESIYYESIDKFKKAEQLEPNNALIFTLWGNALTVLAEIKKEETIYREAFEKYEKASQLDPDDNFSYLLWGETLVNFAEFKQDTNAIKILFDEFYQKSDKLKKLKKDILGIYIIFNNKNMREIIDDKKIFFPLLELNLKNSDSVFFNETTKGITDERELEKYKIAYILSVFIISQLYINNENELLVAHYLKENISQEMLFNNNAFRLNAINYSNDPTEGKILLDYLFGEGKYPAKELNTGYGTFTGCFTFNHDSLNQFRLYGKEDYKEGTGLSLVFKNTFFSKEAKMAMKQDSVSTEDKQQALFRCIYIDPVTRRIETLGQKEEYLFYREKNDRESNNDIKKRIKEYHNYITDTIKSVKHEMEQLQNLVKDLKPEITGQLLINLRYLTKHIAFKEEQECRIIKIHPLNDKETVKINPAPADEKNIQIDNIKQLYIDYQNITGHVEKIYFGPNAEKMELFQDLLKYKGHNIPCERSKNPLS